MREKSMFCVSFRCTAYWLDNRILYKCSPWYSWLYCEVLESAALPDVFECCLPDHNTVDPWSTQVRTVVVHINAGFFLSKYAVCPLYLWVLHQWNQPSVDWKQHSILNLWLGVHRCGGPTVCIGGSHLIQGTWASIWSWLSAGVLEPTSPQIPRDNWSFAGVKSYMWIFNP